MGGRSGPIIVSLYDVAGRRLRQLFEGRLAAGETREIPWDGRDGNGIMLRRGVFFLRLHAPAGDTVTKPIIVLE